MDADYVPSGIVGALDVSMVMTLEVVSVVLGLVSAKAVPQSSIKTRKTDMSFFIIYCPLPLIKSRSQDGPAILGILQVKCSFILDM